MEGFGSDGNEPCSSVEQVDVDLVYSLKVKVKCLESLLQKHEANYSTSLAQSDLQATVVRESERRRDCIELLFHMLE
jgi:hypothetical protein